MCPPQSSSPDISRTEFPVPGNIIQKQCLSIMAGSPNCNCSIQKLGILDGTCEIISKIDKITPFAFHLSWWNSVSYFDHALFMAAEFSTSDMIGLDRDHASWVREADSELQRPISSGHALPRSSSWHLAHKADQTRWHGDSAKQFCEHFLDAHSHVELASIHPYVHIQPGRSHTLIREITDNIAFSCCFAFSMNPLTVVSWCLHSH